MNPDYHTTRRQILTHLEPKMRYLGHHRIAHCQPRPLPPIGYLQSAICNAPGQDHAKEINEQLRRMRAAKFGALVSAACLSFVTGFLLGAIIATLRSR